MDGTEVVRAVDLNYFNPRWITFTCAQGSDGGDVLF